MTNAETLGDLTPIQRDILHAIRNLTQDRGRPPAMSEVLEHVDIGSSGALSYQYRRLEAKGYMRREVGRPRTVQVRLPDESVFPSEAGQPDQLPGHTPERAGILGDSGGEQVVWVPIAGRIAAGASVLAEQSIDGYLPLPREVVGREEGVFIL